MTDYLNFKKMLYLISGLGADERLFKNLRLDVETRYIPWPKPFKNESFRAYCQRMAEPIDRSQTVMLAGISFGGMVAVEMAAFLKVEKIFLISSILSADEFSPMFRLLRKTKVYKTVPPVTIPSMGGVARFFIEPESKEGTKLVKTLLKELDTESFAWSADRLLQWENHNSFKNIIRIHGSSDRIFPLEYLKSFKNMNIIEGGSHFMTFDRAEDVGRVIRENL